MNKLDALPTDAASFIKRVKEEIVNNNLEDLRVGSRNKCITCICKRSIGFKYMGLQSDVKEIFTHIVSY